MTSADDVMDALVRTTFEVAGVLTRIGGEHDLSLTQLRVLGILRDRRARVTELAAYLGLDKSTMSGLIDRAQRRGLLTRGKNPEDGRVVEVYMTPAGLELAKRVEDDIRRALTPATGRLDPEQFGPIVNLLNIVSTRSSRTDT
ncbi:MarR family winged helix-turn-helix transcriptional regulator [Streptosporangium saharense]|uniref:DNA-binding MarR family transcriptional regulator n=1 Tax=Streptosporangium saharense TaxID=1706840 RepID=A0A7W7VM30_9ACTN|nr:MarR family transcriptional regulator [Streptosporangium saharense]MBB4914820.1 DNA-binding MarR family transcriptional regulator [Streptosporangium saharense]